MEPPDTLDRQQAAAMLHADEETVLNLARSGELPGTKIGRSWVFLRVDILEFLRARIQADTALRRREQAARAQPTAIAVAPPRPQQRGRRRTPLPTLPELPTLPSSHTPRSP